MISARSVESVAHDAQSKSHPLGMISPADAETLLIDLAAVFLNNSQPASASTDAFNGEAQEEQLPKAEEIYRALVEQIPAVIFMAHLDRGIGEAYVSPQ